MIFNKPTTASGGGYTVIVIPVVGGSKYSYYVHPTGNIQEGCYIDIAERDKVEKFMKTFDIKSPPTHILTTHQHNHCGELVEQFESLKLYSNFNEKVPFTNYYVEDQEELCWFDNKMLIKCIETPCHTKGAMCYYFDSDTGDMEPDAYMKGEYMVVNKINRCLFTGGTINIAGCGKFYAGHTEDYKGTPEAMLEVMDKIGELSNDTKIFPAHEYTTENFIFATKVEGAWNDHVGDFWDIFHNRLDDGYYSVPAMLGNEKKYNVFMRCRNK